MLTAYIPLARNRDISMRASLVLLLHRALDCVLRRVLAREHPHGGGSLLLELACLAEACLAACQAAFPRQFPTCAALSSTLTSRWRCCPWWGFPWEALPADHGFEVLVAA